MIYSRVSLNSDKLVLVFKSLFGRTATRLLYFKRNVLHRDISSGNLLYMEKGRSTTTALTNTSHQHRFCSIKHLLDPT